MNTQLQSTFGVAVHPSVRCVIGLYGSHNDDDLDEAFSALVDDLEEEDNNNYKGVLNYHLDADIADKVQFLIASQSLKPRDSQVTRVTLVDSETGSLSRLCKHTFDHPDGEITGLTAIPAKPDWFVSTYSSCSTERPELRVSARIWRLPPVDSALTDFPVDDEEVVADQDLVRVDSMSGGGKLEYVTSLPLTKYHGVKRIAPYPSAKRADLACQTGPPVEGSRVYTSSGRLVILQAPSDSASGDYRESASLQLCLPSSVDQLFTSHLKTKPPAHWAKVAMGSEAPVAISSNPNAIRWSPAGTDRLGVAFDAGVLVYDVRSMRPCFWLEAPHWPCTRDLDFNPHRPEVMVTGGDDGCIRLWDLRFLRARSMDRAGSGGSPQSQATEPLYSSQSHSHWVWSVRYHPTHDQLILSAGSDCRVCLHSLLGFSSDAASSSASQLAVGAPGEGHSLSGSDGASDTGRRSLSSDGGTQEMVIPKEPMPDGLVGSLEQHEDSVYTVDWSPVDTWYFASASYDGNLLVSQVPENVKMSILL